MSSKGTMRQRKARLIRRAIWARIGLACTLAFGAEVSTTERPNILFIMTDQQSADVMSCRMGRRYLHTPAMDGLARDGVLFSRAYASNPLCMPLRNSLFTGRYPHETGVTKNARPPGGQLGEQFVSMGTYLRNAGYTTAYSGKWHLCLNQKDTNRHGFEILDSKSKVQPPEDDNYDSRVARGAVRFLERTHQNPFLLVVSLMNPHNICEWARRAAGREQRLKYCVYEHGDRREALYDLEKDPLETINLAGNSTYREVVLKHRGFLRSFAEEHGDPLVALLFAQDVGPRPFPRN